jgi:hypothetical protein
MKTRDGVLLYQETEKDTETETIDLNIVDPVSAINLEIEATNGSTSNLGNFISDIVTKVELVDGSTVLESLNMSQLEGKHFYHTGKTPVLFPSEWPSGTQRHAATLFFGRHLWDDRYAFNPPSWSNPQLKVTFNKAAIRAAGAEGFAAGDNIKLTAVAKIMEGMAAPKEFLMQKQIESFTTASSGEKRIDLPRDYPYRMLMIRTGRGFNEPDFTISNVKLTCDTDKYIPLNRKMQQLDAEAFQMFGTHRLKHDIYRENAAEVLLFTYKEPDCRPYLTETAASHIMAIAYQWSGRLKLRLYLASGGAENTKQQLTMVEEGHAIHGIVPIVFGKMDDPLTWFDPKPYSKFEMVVNQGAADFTTEIVAEQVMTQA